MSERNEQPEPRPTEHEPLTIHPKIYAACLAAYNHGYLHGEWIYADQEPDYLQAEIQDMLEASPIPGAEEWAIHDYEGFGAFDLHEYERLETIARVAGGIALHGTVFSHWIHEVGSEAEDAIETFEGHYLGSWDSLADYAEQLIDDLGADALADAHEWLRPYVTIDHEALGRDLGSELSVAEDPDGVHLFEPR